MAVCGRPFLVQGADRKALAMARSDWLLEPCNSGQVGRERGASEQQQREVAAAYFERIALMEHASIAAFARFQLQLLSLGAPARFVEATNQALVDETKHARLAFALASRFAERELGPGALETRGAFEDDSLASILQTTIVEGCVGETIAALEARAALQQCEDDQVRAALEQIADDETRHAQLAWQVVQWILQERPELATLAREVFASASAPSGPSVDHNLAEPSSGAPAYGVLASEDLARVHDEARLKVVRPCADQMLGALTSADSHGVLPTVCEHFMPGS
jgi:hypothetical protein